MFKRFLTDHGDTADSLAKSGGGVLTIYALLSGPWTFASLGGAAAAFGVAVTALKKLQEIADGGFTGKSHREKYRLLLSLAAREAYLSAAMAEISKTLKAHEERGIPTFGTAVQLEDLGPDLGASASTSLAAQAAPVFEFLEKKLLVLLARAEVPDSERQKCCQRILAEAGEELIHIVAGNPKRFGSLTQTHLLRAANQILSASSGGSTAGKVSINAENSTPLPSLANDDPDFVRPAEPVAPPPSSTLANASAPAPALTGTLKMLYEERFLKARQELETGSNAVSAKLFDDLAGELRTLAQPELLPLLVRCLHNQGISLYNTYRRLEAASCFEEAMTYPQQTSRTKLGRFFAPYCREDFVRALAEVEAVIREHPEETTYYVHQAECLWRLEREDEALALLEGHPSEVESYYTLLSQLQAAHDQFAKAKATAESGLKAAPASNQLRMAVLFADTKPLFNRLHRERQTRRFVSEADRQLLNGACAQYEKVAEEAKRDGLKVIESDAVAMVGNIRLALGDSKEAIIHFDRALALLPGSQAVLGNKYLALVRSKDTVTARKFAEESAGIWGMAESLGRQAAAWLEEGKADVAADLLEKAFAATPELKQNTTLRVVWLQALGIAKRPEAKAEALAFVSEPARGARDLISAAEILESTGEKEETDKLIARAEAAAGEEPEDGLLVRTVAGLIYYRRDAWGEAISRLGTNGMDPVESEHVTEIIVCLINLNDVAGAVKLAERMIEVGRGTPAIERALAHCYLRIGRESAAEPLLRSIVVREGKFRDRLSLFQLLRQLRPLRTALPVLEEAVKAFPDRMEGHLILSASYLMLRQHALSLAEAREAQRLSPDHPEVVRHFARFIQSTFPARLLNDSDRAMMRRAMADRKLFTPIEMTERDGQLDITWLLTRLKERREHVTLVMEHYRKQRLPLCFVAGLLGETTFNLWWAFSRGLRERIFLTRGNAGSAEEEDKACEQKAVVLDMTALFTLAELGLLDLPNKCFEQIYVDTATLVQLKNEQSVLGLQPETQQVAHYHEGKLLMQETDPADHRARVARLNEIVGFLHDNPRVKVHGPNAAVWAEFQGNKQVQEAAEAMPAGAFGPALIAKTEGAAYYSDDEGLRGMLVKEFKVEGFSTQALLRRAAKQCLLDERAYDAAVVTLLHRNYHFVSVDRRFILRHLRREGFVRNRVADRLLAEIGSTTFGRGRGTLEAGVMAGCVWLNTYTDGAPARRDWLKPIAQAVAGLPAEQSALLYFLLGLLVELLRFPALFIGITDALIYDAELPPKVTRGLQLARYQVINHMQTQMMAGDPTVAALWNKTVKEAERCRKLAGIKRRL